MEQAGEWMWFSLGVLGWFAFGVAILAGLMLDLLGLFGNWIILGAVVVAWLLTGFEHFTVVGISIMLVFAIVGEVLETALAGYGASKFGGSKGSIMAALVGTIAGAILGSPLIPIPVVGTLLGAFLGAFLAAAIYEYIQHQKDARTSAWVGLGAMIGKLGGMFAKFSCGILMLFVAWYTFAPEPAVAPGAGENLPALEQTAPEMPVPAAPDPADAPLEQDGPAPALVPQP